MQGDGARLDVGANTHLLGRADDHRHLAGPARFEQPGLLGVVARLVNEPHPLGGDAALGEQVTKFVVGVPRLLLGGGEVAEDDLQRPGDGGGDVGAGEEVAPLGVGAVDRGDLVGGVVELAAPFEHGSVDQAHVERGAAAVAGDLEHVVLARVNAALAEPLGARGELQQVGVHLRRRGDDDGTRAVDVLGAGGVTDARAGQVEVLGRLDVRGHLPHPQHLRDVAELREPGLDPVVPAAGRRHLERGDALAERGGPLVEVVDVRVLEQVGPEVALHHVRLGDAVGDRRGRRERGDTFPLAGAEVLELHVEVGGSLGAGDLRVCDVGLGGEVFVQVRLVDEQVVDPGRLEADRGIELAV